MFENLKGSRKKFAQPPGTLFYTGEGLLPTTIKTIQYNKDELHINENLSKEKYTNWIQIDGLRDYDKVMETLKDYNLDSMLIEDIFNLNQRAKIEEIDQGFFAVVSTSDISKPDFSREYYVILLLDNTVFTFIDLDSKTLNVVEKRINDKQGVIRSMKANYLFYAIIDTLIDLNILFEHDATSMILNYEDLVLEDKIENLQKLHYFRKELLFMKSTIGSFNESITDLKIKNSTNPNIQPVRKYYMDLLDHIMRLNQRLNVHWEEIRNLYDIYMNNLSDRTNSIMKTLTIFSAIFIPLSFLAGVFGMNFVHMEIFKSPYGVYIFIAACLVIAGIMVSFFHHKKWF